MLHTPWFETAPKRYKRELDALIERGIEPHIDSTALGQGILRLSFTIQGDNPSFGLTGLVESIELSAVYPDSFPYFRPEVTAPGLALPRHQNPVGKNLCLLPRPAHHWLPEWTLATFLELQLPKVLQKGAIVDLDQIALDLDEQAEPASSYYADPRTAVLFDTSAIEEVVEQNEQIRILGKMEVGLPKKAGFFTRMAVLSTQTTGEPIVPLPETFGQSFPHRLTGHLVRLSKAPPAAATDGLRWLLKELEAQGNRLLTKPLVFPNGLTFKRIVGICFPEETGRGVMGTGWLFLVEGSVKTSIPGPRGKPVLDSQPFCYYGKVSRISPKDLQLRVPTLAALNQQAIAVVGLGALGAPTALEFARNQTGELRLMDFDFVEPGPTVRWPLGLAYAGQLKTAALQQFIKANYPRTNVVPISHKVGGTRAAGTLSESQAMDSLLNGVSLLFDASADKGVSQFLADQAKLRGIPFISIYATPGAWGGMVMRVVPNKSMGCWMCLQHHMLNGSIPTPKIDESGDVQAAGCGDMTFTGASFDLQNITLAGVRLALSTLSVGQAGGYPDGTWDVGVVSMMDHNDQLIPPTWHVTPLTVHPDCLDCNHV
jgi:molybdopterin/thiamine biosynthesis adenylyltransferase